jgi:hypothetical protein
VVAVVGNQGVTQCIKTRREPAVRENPLRYGESALPQPRLTQPVADRVRALCLSLFVPECSS